MITLEMCLDYIENKRSRWSEYQKEFKKYGDWRDGSITLSKAQKKFLGNLCEGKITDTPRNFGKTFIINLYAECLNYYTDMCKYGGYPDADEYITLREANDSVREIVGKNIYFKKYIVNAYDENPEHAMREYNFSEDDLDYINDLKEKPND